MVALMFQGGEKDLTELVRVVTMHCACVSCHVLKTFTAQYTTLSAIYPQIRTS
jgi:hypothetical protein